MALCRVIILYNCYNHPLLNIGHFRINTECLQLGQQIRPIDEEFVKTLINEMDKFADECYQPVCVILQGIPASEFHEQKVIIKHTI